MNNPDGPGGTDAADTGSRPDTAGDTRTDTMPMGPGVCVASQVIDLNARGTHTGAITSFTGTTTTANATVEVAPADGCIASGYTLIRQVAHSYRTTAAAILRVSTANMGTPSGMGGHDTGVLILDMCDTRGAMSLGCNDDASQQTLASTATSTAIIPAGTTVTIIVGSVVPSGMTGAGAAYELSVEELQPIAAGGVCAPGASPDLCAMGNTCTANSNFAEQGHCTADGTAAGTHCRPMSAASRCDGGMSCVTINEQEYCFMPANPGMPCDRSTHCEMTSECVPNDPSTTLSGTCQANGQQGGVCDAMTTCAAMTTCSDATNGGTCRATIADGMACDPTGFRTACATTSRCVPAATGTGFVCAANGTAAGTACRDAAPRCDTGLDCTTTTGAGLCFATLGATATACNPHFGVNHCTAPAVCGATNFTTGRCTMPTPEPTTAHATPMAAGAPITTPAVISGALAAATDIDCYALTVPANGSIYAEVNDGAGGCPANADSVILVYDSMFHTIDGNDDSLMSLCSVLDGTHAGSASHGLAAGTYYLCVRPYPGTMPIPQYFLNVNVTP